MKLPKLITVYQGRRVYTKEAPDELVSKTAVKDACERIKKTLDSITGNTPDKVALRAEYQSHLDELEALLPRSKPKPKPVEKPKREGIKKDK